MYRKLISKIGQLRRWGECFSVPASRLPTDSQRMHGRVMADFAFRFGEKFSLQKHPQGTEIKAITKHDMKIIEKDGAVHVYVVVDI